VSMTVPPAVCAQSPYDRPNPRAMSGPRDWRIRSATADSEVTAMTSAGVAAVLPHPVSVVRAVIAGSIRRCHVSREQRKPQGP